MKIFQTRQIWTKIVSSFKYVFLVGSFSTTFRPFSTQPRVSRSVWTKGWNFVVKLSKRFQALSHYLMTPNFKIDFLPWWENDQRTNRRKLHQNWPPRCWDITMNSHVVWVFVFSKHFFQPNISPNSISRRRKWCFLLLLFPSTQDAWVIKSSRGYRSVERRTSLCIR